MGFYHSDTVSISLFESTAWDFESRQKHESKALADNAFCCFSYPHQSYVSVSVSSP